MIVFDVKIRQIKFDKSKYTEALGRAIQVKVRNAAREWLRAVLPLVPVYSGESRAAFIPIGRYLNVVIPISPDPIGHKRNPLGIEKGQASSQFKFNNNGRAYWFEYHNDVLQFLINEFNVGLGSPPLRHPTPWHSLDAGNEAFKTYLLNNLKKDLPRIKDYLVEGGSINNG